jgi:hypothetical protein
LEGQPLNITPEDIYVFWGTLMILVVTFSTWLGLTLAKAITFVERKLRRK